jgi:ssRNA-specific RNase YbeY (16S rRNA maturation enzyme)
VGNKEASLTEVTRHAIHELLHEVGLDHRSQAMGSMGSMGLRDDIYNMYIYIDAYRCI